jgi:endonuclease YncB( thermonuclease family)
MHFVRVLGTVVALLAAAVPAAGQDDLVLVGVVTKIVDGDTIDVELDSGPIRVRFDSVDAPERAQPWGKEATAALSRRVSGKEVELAVSEQDRYERLVATVYVHGESVNAWLVQQGHAWAYRQYTSNKDYCAWEDAARAARRGLWGNPSKVEAPWDHRAIKRRRIESARDYSDESVDACIAALGKRATAGATSPAAPMSDESPWDDCDIKGNIGDAGKIYHLPGTSSYQRTKIDESKGERWFCTEEEAKSFGWRAPRSAKG